MLWTLASTQFIRAYCSPSFVRSPNGLPEPRGFIGCRTTKIDVDISARPLRDQSDRVSVSLELRLSNAVCRQNEYESLESFFASPMIDSGVILWPVPCTDVVICCDETVQDRAIRTDYARWINRCGLLKLLPSLSQEALG